MSTTFNRNESKLLLQIPWYTNHVLGPDALQEPDLQEFAETVRCAEQELCGSSSDAEAARRILQIGDHQDTDSSSSVGVMYFSKAVNRVLAYRVLDICQWVKIGGSSVPPVDCVDIDGTSLFERLKLQKLRDPPALILNTASLLRSRASNLLETSASVGFPQSGDPTQRLFNSVASFIRENKGEKVLTNFEVAAMHLGVHFQGHWDIVGSPLEEGIRTLVNKILTAGTVENRFACLRLPLSLALSVSPIVLLQDKILWNFSVKRKLVLDALLVFCNKPPIVLKIECELWKALIDISKGISATFPRVMQALDSIQGILGSGDITSTTEWFVDCEARLRLSGSSIIHQPTSDSSHAPPAPAPSTRGGDICPFVEPNTAESSTLAPLSSTTASSIGLPVRPNTPRSAIDSRKLRALPEGSEGEDSHMAEDALTNASPLTPRAPRHESATSNPQRNSAVTPDSARSPGSMRCEDAKQSRRKAKQLERHQHRVDEQRRRKRERIIQRRRQEEVRRKVERYERRRRNDKARQTVTSCPEARRQIEYGNKPSAPLGTTPWPTTPPGFIDLTIPIPRYIDPTRVVRSVPLVVQDRGGDLPGINMARRLTLPVGCKKIRGHRTIDLYTPSGQSRPYNPEFHLTSELYIFYELAGQLNATNIDRQSPMTITFVPYQEFEKLTYREAQLLLRQHHVVLEKIDTWYNFDAFGLGSLFGMYSQLAFIDGTHETEKFAVGSVQHLLDSADAVNGNVISTRRVAMPLSNYPPPFSVASDLFAWRSTMEQPYCKRRVQFPESGTRWATAAIRGAFGEWTVGEYGCCTYITVLTGAQWVVVARPKQGDEYGFGDTSLRLGLFDPTGCNSHLWDVEAVLLEKGFQLIIRPNTPYRLLATENTACAGGGFYAMSTITESCIGMMQSFIGGSLCYDRDQPGACRRLLSRMLTYVHLKFVIQDALWHPETETGHLPDLNTLDGILAVLSLCNVAELANVLHPDTYRCGVEPEERMHFIHVRKLARELVRWVGNHYDIREATGVRYRQKPLPSLYLHHQARALQTAKRSSDNGVIKPVAPEFTSEALDLQLESCLGETWAKLQPSSVSSFYWAQGTHQVLRRAKPLEDISDLDGRTPDDVTWMLIGISLAKRPRV